MSTYAPLLLILWTAFASLAAPADSLAWLSEDQRLWLSRHPVIRVAPDPSFPPIEWIDSTGHFRGIASDYVALMERRLGVRFQLVHCESWDEVLEKARNRDVDMLSAAAQSPRREKYLLFSRPHIEFPAVIISRRNVTGNLTLEKLAGMRVAVVSGYVWEEFITRDYPDMKLDLVPDIQTGLRKVAFGLADATLENLASATHYLEQEGITNLRVAGETEYISRLSFAVRSDWPQLHAILDKAVRSISDEERTKIRDTWISLDTAGISSPFNRSLAYALAVSLGVTLLLSGGIVTWNHSLRRQVEQRTDELKRQLAHRQSIEESLRVSEHKYRELVENANSMILRLDHQGRITFFNEYAQSFFGYSSEEILGKPCIGTIVPETESSTGRDMKEMIARVVSHPSDFLRNENENMKKDGERVWIAWSNRPVFDEQGRLKEILSIGSDITARKQAEEEARVNQRKLIQADRLATLGTLVSGVAHEINNPTNYISLNNENLAEIWADIKRNLDRQRAERPSLQIAGLPYEEVKAETDRLIDAIGEGTNRIKTIVKGLKEFARQDGGDDSATVDINTVVKTALLILGASIRKATDAFSVDYGEGLPPVAGDFQRIEQVVINLITNACQALSDRTKAVRLVTQYQAQSGEVRIEVRDEGVGIDPENLDRVFDPFFTTKRTSGGTGLGLSISYSIIKELKGELSIDSAPGTGTTAVITLPQANRGSS
jgi:PAS domain S-box-containing protein